MTAGDDEDSFARLVGKVRRLRQDTVALARPRPPLAARRAARGVAPAPAPSALPATDVAREAPPASHQRAGVQQAVLRKLKRGHYPVEAELDLHGLTVRAAGQRLAAFLAGSRRERTCCVRIIHGKGLSSPGMQPVLKPQVLAWLRAHDAVLAYTAARDRDGGSGAVYVLLRSR